MERLRAIEEAWERCRLFMEGVQYRGYDPYDALLSPLWQSPVLRAWRWGRRLGQQLVLRCPLNLRPLLRIPPGQNPVTLALALEGYVRAWEVFPERRSLWQERVSFCIMRLLQLRSPGWEAAWGYDFPWEARSMSLRAYDPTIVATGIVTNALFQAAMVLGQEHPRQLCQRAAEELVRRFPRSYEDATQLCWAYSPFDRQQVLNATAMGARLCAQAYAVSGEEEFLALARRSIRFVLQHQRPDGAFPYAVGQDRRQWVDHFHTGYVLECLQQCYALTRDATLVEPLQRGWRYYRCHLFTAEGLPRFRPQRTYPIDATACAQALRTLSCFGEHEAAQRLAQWAIATLQLPDGSFAYRRYRWWTWRTVFMRWSVAWMFSGLSYVLAARGLGGGHARLD